MVFRNMKEWNAWTVPDGPGMVEIHVTGLVETTASNQIPQIPEAHPQGVEPDILILDLVIVSVGDDGAGKASFRKARFSKKTAPGRYAMVHVRAGGEIVARIPVEDRAAS